MVNLLSVFYAVLLYCKRYKLREVETKAVYGTLYEGLCLPNRNHEIEWMRNKRVWFYPPIFMLRRTFFALTTVFFYDVPYIQMICL